MPDALAASARFAPPLPIPQIGSGKMHGSNHDSTRHASRFATSGTFLYPPAMVSDYQKSFRQVLR
jgi:hypothetical protein